MAWITTINSFARSLAVASFTASYWRILSSWAGSGSERSLGSRCRFAVLRTICLFNRRVFAPLHRHSRALTQRQARTDDALRTDPWPAPGACPLTSSATVASGAVIADWSHRPGTDLSRFDCYHLVSRASADACVVLDYSIAYCLYSDIAFCSEKPPYCYDYFKFNILQWLFRIDTV